MSDTLVPPASSDDDDDVVLALETARAEEERGQHGEAARWVLRAASAARKQGRPNRAGELSRAQAMLTELATKFQHAHAREHVLDSDDDFTEHTIVDRPPTMPDIESPAPAPPAAPASAPVQRASAPPPPPRSPEEPVKQPSKESTKSLSAAAPAYATVRVAVRRTNAGFEARTLREGESAGPREDEALLVSLRPGTRW